MISMEGGIIHIACAGMFNTSGVNRVSHGLRAPLRGLDGWSLALFEDCGDKLDAQAHEYLRQVRTQSRSMGRLIDDLLNLFRVTLAGLPEGLFR